MKHHAVKRGGRRKVRDGGDGRQRGMTPNEILAYFRAQKPLGLFSGGRVSSSLVKSLSKRFEARIRF